MIASRRLLTLLALSCILHAGAADAPPAGAGGYANDFDDAEAGSTPDEFLVLSGEFTVAAIDGNKCLELPGAPLDYHGVLFGPAEHRAVEVAARIWADRTVNRYPEFGVGAGDAFGYRLWLVPAQRVLQLRKGDDVVASAPCEWTPATWTLFRLTIRAEDGVGWKVSGEVVPERATDQAKSVTVTFDEKGEPPAGRGSVWGAPFSDKPIRFDDLRTAPPPARGQ